jgi:hypothetical protein
MYEEPTDEKNTPKTHTRYVNINLQIKINQLSSWMRRVRTSTLLLRPHVVLFYKSRMINEYGALEK